MLRRPGYASLKSDDNSTTFELLIDKFRKPPLLVGQHKFKSSVFRLHTPLSAETLNVGVIPELQGDFLCEHGSWRCCRQRAHDAATDVFRHRI